MPPSSNMKAAWVFFPGIFLRLFNQKIDMTLGGCVSELQKITKLRSNNTHNPNIPFSLSVSLPLSHTHTHTHTQAHNSLRLWWTVLLIQIQSWHTSCSQDPTPPLTPLGPRIRYD